MTRYFANLEVVPFKPQFEWVHSIDECARLINKPHEDYPQRVHLTQIAIRNLIRTAQLQPLCEILTPLNLARINVFLGFSETPSYRQVGVKVGLHVPPMFDLVPKFMTELYLRHEGGIPTTEALIDWYADLETIHPFEDGNGRVGGVVVALFSHLLRPLNGYLAPKTERTDLELVTT